MQYPDALPDPSRITPSFLAGVSSVYYLVYIIIQIISVHFH